MSDPSAIAAERDDWKRRAEANHSACEAMQRQLEECAEGKARSDIALEKLEERYRILEENYLDAKREITQMKADREFSV